jgi:hypothetical protein
LSSPDFCAPENQNSDSRAYGKPTVSCIAARRGRKVRRSRTARRDARVARYDHFVSSNFDRVHLTPTHELLDARSAGQKKESVRSE